MTKNKYEGMHISELDEAIATQQSLKDYPKHNKKATDDAAKRAAEIMKSLSPEARQAHLDDLEQSLKDHNAGDGVPDGTAEESRASLRNAQKMKKDMPTLKKQMKETFGPDLSDDLLEKMAVTFLDAVENAAENASFRNKMVEMLTDNPELRMLMLHSDDDLDDLDIAEALAMRVDELESQIAAAEAEYESLKSEKLARESLKEETLFAHSPTRSIRRSYHNVADDLEGTDPDSTLMETNQGQHIDPRMGSYLRKIEETTRNTDHHPINESLIAAWKVNN